MLIDGNGIWKEKNTKTVKLKCNKCENTADNFVVGGFTSIHIGFVFMPKNKHLGKKRYVLCCPICGNINKEISLNELYTLRIKMQSNSLRENKKDISYSNKQRKSNSLNDIKKNVDTDFEEVKEQNYFKKNHNEDGIFKQRIDEINIQTNKTNEKIKSHISFKSILIGGFMGITIGVIVTTLLLNDKYEAEMLNISAERTEDTKSLADKDVQLSESNNMKIKEEQDESSIVYTDNEGSHLKDDWFNELKTESHILNWGYAVFEIYNGTEYTINEVIIEITVYDDAGNVTDTRKFKENSFFGIEPYSIKEIKFDTGIKDIGQVSEDDSHIPEYLVSWKFVDVIVME